MSVFDSRIRLQRQRLDELMRRIAILDQLAVRLGEEQRRIAAKQRKVEGGGAGAELVQRARKLAQSLVEVEAEAGEARQAATAGMAAMRRFEALAGRRRRPKISTAQQSRQRRRPDGLRRRAAG